MMAKSAGKKKSRRHHRDLHPPPPPPPSSRRTLRPRRRRIPVPDDFINSSSDDEERGKRKLKLVVKLPHVPARNPTRFSDSPGNSSSSDPVSPPTSPSSASFVDDDEEEEEEVKPLKKRRIERSGGSSRCEERMKNPSVKPKGRVQGVCNGSRMGTRLPDHKILEMVLDKLQKKDTYGVFAEPVDSEELPDYHDVIEHPMDFGTVRKKLARNAYRCFEQFEDDVFLICSNAMQYNAPDTIYFRQARSIQEMARKKFQMLRSDGAHKTQTFVAPAPFATQRNYEDKVNSIFIEKKVNKKPVCITSKERLGSDNSSGATLPLMQDTVTVMKTTQINESKRSTIVNRGLDRTPPLVESKSDKADEVSARCSPTQHGTKVLLVAENQGANDCPLKEEPVVESDSLFTASAKSSPCKNLRKSLIVDENRRATYSANTEEQMVESDLTFAVFGSEAKQLTVVGDYVEYSYARSLARFAGSLGPVAWKIASEKIEKALPAGVKFGPGWVGEYEPLPTPILSFESHMSQLGHSSKLKKHRENEGRTKVTRTSGLKDVQLGHKTQIVSGQCNGSSNQPKEGGTSWRETMGGKRGWFGVASETKPSITFAMLQKQKDRLTVDLPQASANLAEHLQPSNSTSVITTETALQRPLGCSEATTSRSFETILRNSNHRQPDNLKQQEMRKPERENAILGMDLRGFNGGNPAEKSDIDRSNASLGIISNQQSKVTNNDRAHGSQEQPIDDPCRIMSLPGKIFYKSNANVGVHTLKQVCSPLQQPRRENASAAAVAAQAWMSIGAPAEHKSMDISRYSKSQVELAPLHNSFWKMPMARTGVNEDQKTRQLSQVLPQSTQVSEESQVKNQGFVLFPQLLGNDSSRQSGQAHWQCLAPHVQQRQRSDMLPPDLNISCQPPGSPVRQSSSILMDSQQPDLALQL